MAAQRRMVRAAWMEKIMSKTFISLLVVIAIIAILIGLFIPATV